MEFPLTPLHQSAKLLPSAPGIYQFIGPDGVVIYVGKAKDLKKRVLSYFRNDVVSGKVLMMLKKAAELRYTVVATEHDALLLENNMVKELQPRYNILLKDDKTFPWICIKNEPFPRIFPTRNVVRDGSKYFGPYSSVRLMRTLLELITQLYPLRNCTLALTDDNIQKKKFKHCLEFQVGNCLAPCEGRQTADDYNRNIDAIRNIIKGNVYVVEQELKRMMAEYAATYEFEKAQVVKEKMEALQKYQARSVIVSPAIHNVDVFSMAVEDGTAYVNCLHVANGAIVQTHTIELKNRLDESNDELLAFGIIELRTRFESDAPEVIVPFDPGIDIPGCEFTIPLRGDKKNLLDLSERNVKFYLLDKKKHQELVDPERHSKRVLEQAMKDLRLKELPVHIECFDNSNTQGDEAVSALVVFKNAKPAKKEYRHYNIRTVVGPDDFASMEEVVLRRYKRLLDEQQPLPQLIIVDGGKGQLSAALNSLERLGIRNRVSIIGIAKRLEEIYYPDDSIPLYIDKKSETLKLIQQLRDEAHRFGITHHRARREKATIKTALTGIPGIGKNTAEKLLAHFHSVKTIQTATTEELARVIGEAKGNLVYTFFQEK